MSEEYKAAAYWSSRPESAEQCAKRAATFFRLMGECHPSYARWYEQHNSIRKALRLGFEPTVETFTRFFEMKKNQIFSDGFTFSTWTGRLAEDQGSMVMLRCGSDALVTPNWLLLYLSSEQLGSERTLTTSVLTCIMNAMAEAWEPDWALATSDGLWEQLSGGSRLGCFVGWMTYFARSRGTVPALPHPARVEPVGERGTLVTLTPERLTASNSEHVALARRTQQVLEEHRLLRPILERARAQ